MRDLYMFETRCLETAIHGIPEIEISGGSTQDEETVVMLHTVVTSYVA